MASAFRYFLDFVLETLVLPSDKAFAFASLESFENAKQLFNRFIEYYIHDRQLIGGGGTKKRQELQRRKKMTQAEKLQAAGMPLPSTVSGLILSLTGAVS